MTDSTVSALAAASALGGTENMLCTQGGVSVRLTPAQIKTYIELGIAPASVASPVVVVGTGDSTSSPAAGSLSAPSAAGTNIAGANLLLRGGNQTGSGAGGKILLRTATTSAGGGTATGIYSTRVTVDETGVVATVPVSATNLSGTNTGDQTITLTGDATGSGTGSFAVTVVRAPVLTTGRTISITGDLAYTSPAFDGSGNVTAAGTIQAGAVTLTKMANLAANSILGNNTGSAATPIALTATQATAFLNTFTTSLAGLAPASGGGTTNFLRADGTWTAPAGGVQMNFAATSDPVVGNDSSQGYAAGSVWMRSDTGDVWRCRSASVGAAKWVRMDVADHAGYVAARWYTFLTGSAPLAGSPSGSGTIRLFPMVLKQRMTVSDIAVRVTSAAASGNVHIGIYAASTTTKLPTGTPLLVSSTGATGLSTTSATIISTTLGANVTLDPGIYWMAGMADNASSAFQTVSDSTVYASLIGDATSSNISSGSTTTHRGLQVTGQTFSSGLPDLTSATFSASGNPTAPLLMLKVASVP